MGLVLVLSMATSFRAAGQDRGNYKLSGVVSDSLSHLPVEFVNVALIDPGTNRPIDGAVCNEKGEFVINKVNAGRYLIVVSFIGYTTKRIPTTIGGTRREIRMNTILLASAIKVLQEVEVKGQKELFEEKVDRTVYNAEQDQTTRGGDATDVLKRVPMLSVDMDGNVSLKGSSSVRVLINNKPSTITATSVADALKQIPADMIKSVEVITSPSAAYDAEGSAGIINIILKKNSLEGVFANGDVSGGNRGTNANANVSYRRGKTGLSIGAFQRWQYNVVSDYSNDQTTRSDSDTLLNSQTNHNRSHGIIGQYTLNYDFDLDKKNSFNVSLRYGKRQQFSYQDNLLTNTYEQETLINSTLRNVATTVDGKNLDGSLSYTRDFDKKGRQLNFLAIYSNNNQNLEYISDPLATQNPADFIRYRNVNNGTNLERSAQIDYQEPIAERQMIEVGGKVTWRNVTSDYQYFTSSGNSEPWLPSSAAHLSNNFKYYQNIVAGYVSYSVESANGWMVKAGARYEYTAIGAHFEGQEDLTIPSYGFVVPSINLTRKLSQGRQFRVSYNRRIVRPWLQALNPNLQASSGINASLGNPNLKPEVADNYEISFKTNLPKGTLNLSLWSRYNTNDIQPARIVRNDTIVAVYQNIGSEGNFGLATTMAFDISNDFSIVGSIDWIYRVLKNNSADPILNATNSGFTQNYRLTGRYSFGNGWSSQLFIVFQGKSFNLQGYRTGLNTQSVAVQKEIWNKKGSVGLGLDNFATPKFTVYTYLDSPYVTQRTATTLANFIVKLNFSYRIGKKLEQREHKLKADESES